MTTVSSTSSTSGTISSVGIGSGLDVDTIISGLMKVEKAPLTDLTKAATTIQTTISAFGAVQSALSDFRDAASALALPSTWNATSGTSSDPTAVSVATTSNAATGSYAVSVTSLAASQSTVSGTFAATDTVGAGTLHIDIGSWASDNSAFTARTGAAGVDIAVTDTDTLDTLAGKINSAGAGVSASVVNDTTGSRLVLTSSTSGLDNTFRITSNAGNNTTGLGRLAYDPAGGTTATTRAQAAGNASATINGVPVTSQTNTLANVFNGITVTLGQANAGQTVQLSVTQDNTSLTKSVQTFVDSYNALATLLATDLKYDSATKDAGPLQGDSTARSLQLQLRSIMGSSSGASTAFSTLSQVGLQAQKDGTLTLNSAKLTSAMANPGELKKLFTNVDLNNAGKAGFANQLRAFGDKVLGINGILTTRTAGLKTKLGSNEKNQATLQDRLDATEARLKAQYTALDKKMASISGLGTYVTQQITNWNKNTA